MKMFSDMQIRDWLLLLGLIAIAGRTASGTTLARMSVEDLTKTATVIARVRCTGSESRWQSGEIWTFTMFQVREVWKGSAPPTITVRLIGGRTASLTSIVPGVPRFEPGEETVLFLEPLRGGDYSVTAWAEGTFRVRRGSAGGRETVTQDSAAYSSYDAKTHELRLEGVRALPIATFRNWIQRMLGQITRANQ